MSRKRVTLRDLLGRFMRKDPERLAPVPDLGDLYPGRPSRLRPEPDPAQAAPPLFCDEADLGDLIPARPPPYPPAPSGAPSLASRERLDLGDLEPSAAPDAPPPAPERHAVLEDLTDAGGWVVIDRGEYELYERLAPWNKPVPPARRKRRYGVVSVADCPASGSVTGSAMSYDEALRTAEDLDRIRETMES